MSDWNLLNQRRISLPGYPDTDASWGFCGAFILCPPDSNFEVLCIASDGAGWQHVSVSIPRNPRVCVRWQVMCWVKELFWEPEDAVIQIHPPRSTYINNHPGCLHLWRCIDGREQPLPPALLVGLPTP